MTLVARWELRLREEGYKGTINSAINTNFPSRSTEVFKRLRKQSKYKDIINEITLLTNNVQTEINGSSQSSQSDPSNKDRASPYESEQIIPDWAITVLDAIDISHIYNTSVFEKLIPGEPDEYTRKLIDSEYSAWLNANALNNKKPKKKRQPHNDSILTASRWRRRFFYRKMQNLYAKNKSVAAEQLLEGTWEKGKESPKLSMFDMIDAWKEIFTSKSLPDNGTPSQNQDTHWCLLKPITIEEIHSIRNTKDSSFGPYTITIKELNAIPAIESASHFNLWLLVGTQPSEMCVGRTIFIPKVDDPTSLEHRPQTIASVIIRLYHKIMAKRWEATLILHSSQKGFLEGDGIAQHVWTLRAIIDEAKSNLKPINMVFVDVKKAFHSVSHETMLLALKRLGIPFPIVNYVKELYSRSVTIFQYNGACSETIKVGRGIKQGDPLSPLIFNAVIGWAISALDPILGVSLNGSIINCLAYADDIVLLSKTQLGLKSLPDSLVMDLGLGGWGTLVLGPKENLRL